jgi:hypothetical protein
MPCMYITYLNNSNSTVGVVVYHPTVVEPANRKIMKHGARIIIGSTPSPPLSAKIVKSYTYIIEEREVASMAVLAGGE